MNLLDVRRGALFVEPIRHRHRFRMVRNRDVFVTQLARRFRHFFDGIFPVACCRVHLQIALDVLQRQQVRQLVLLRCRDFAGVFPQLGRDIVQLEPRVNLFFGAPRHRLIALQRCQRVFIQRQSHVVRAPSQHHVVLLRAREIHQRRAKILFFEQAHVHLQPICQPEADLVLPMRQDLIDIRKFQDVFGERIHMFLRRESVCQRHQQIQIAYGFFPAPQRACGRHRIHRFSRFLDVLRECQRCGFGRVDQKPSRGFLKYFHRLQNILFAFLAEARQVAQLLFSGEFFYVRNRGRFEI